MLNTIVFKTYKRHIEIVGLCVVFFNLVLDFSDRHFASSPINMFILKETNQPCLYLY